MQTRAPARQPYISIGDLQSRLTRGAKAAIQLDIERNVANGSGAANGASFKTSAAAVAN